MSSLYPLFARRCLQAEVTNVRREMVYGILLAPSTAALLAIWLNAGAALSSIAALAAGYFTLVWVQARDARRRASPIPAFEVDSLDELLSYITPHTDLDPLQGNQGISLSWREITISRTHVSC